MGQLELWQIMNGNSTIVRVGSVRTMTVMNGDSTIVRVGSVRTMTDYEWWLYNSKSWVS